MSPPSWHAFSRSRVRTTIGAALLAAGLAAWACSGPPPGSAPRAGPPRADLILHHGRVATLDAGDAVVEALAVRGDRIVALGSDDAVLPLAGAATRMIDLAGRLAVPGFIEGHGHFMGVGEMQRVLDLRGARSWDAIVAQVAAAAAAAAPGEWIRGRGWHQDKWDTPPTPAVEGLPTHASLSLVSPANPVVLTHASGHAAFVNARALGLAGMRAGTPDPAGGQILRDASGEPTGFLRERAQDRLEELLAAADPQGRTAEERRVAELAVRESLENGITTFQDAGSSLATIELLRRLVDEGKMPLRLWVMIREPLDVLARELPGARLIGHGGDRLTVRAVKVSLDGALGTRGAWLLAPYEDAPHLVGLNTVPLDTLERIADLALAHEFQVAVHAIGDRANRETLDLFERVFERAGERRDRRWRIEHAQHLDPADVPRFASLGVIPSMQTVHCTSDGPWVPDRLGERRAREGAYVWRDLIRSGSMIANGTDAPVEDLSPIASFHAAVTRRTAGGALFYPEQRMTRDEALRAMTINAAYAAFEEEIKGTLEVGKLADITVLSRDILSVAEEDLTGAKVDLTIVGGRVEYSRD